jgi:precorrin-6B methylase 2
MFISRTGWSQKTFPSGCLMPVWNYRTGFESRLSVKYDFRNDFDQEMSMNKVIGFILVCAILFSGCAEKKPSFTLVDRTAGETPASAQAPDVAEPTSATTVAPAESTTAEQTSASPVQPKHEPDVIFVPTPQDVVDKMLELAQVTTDDVVYDLGCGDGRIVVTAAKRYGCKAIGYDVDPQRIKESKENVEKNGVGDLVRIEQQDIFTLDLSKASVVTLYLLPRLNVKLIPQLEKLKPGSRIVSHDFRMKGVAPEKTVTLTSEEDQAEHKIFLWTAPIQKGKKEDSPAQ